MNRTHLGASIGASIMQSNARAEARERIAAQDAAAAAAALPDGLLDEGDLVALIRGVPRHPRAREIRIPHTFGAGYGGFRKHPYFRYNDPEPQK
jgi:hypothetical protein